MAEAIDIAKAVKNLSDVFLLQDLDEPQLKQIAQLCDLQWLARGDYIMREDGEADSIYILLRGEVTVSKKLQLPHLEHIHGEDRILTSITADSYPVLGETALVGQDRRSATVRCATGCVLYQFDAAAFFKLLLEDAAIGRAVFRRLCETLYERMETTSADVVKLSAALVYALGE